MRRFMAGLVVGILLFPASVFLYLRYGHPPVATNEPPMLFERYVARSALHSRINREMPTVAPFSADEANMTAGARIYSEQCAFCHGLPDQSVPAAAKGMFPKPPQLFVHTVTDDPLGMTYWKVANGIRLTGMPGYVSSLSTEQNVAGEPAPGERGQAVGDDARYPAEMKSDLSRGFLEDA